MPEPSMDYQQAPTVVSPPRRSASTRRHGQRRIPRKPVPQRRPNSSRSFTQAFAWLSGALMTHDSTPTVHEEEPKQSGGLNRHSYRYTSQFDPRMESGFTLYDPDLQPTHLPKQDHSTRSSVVDALNLDWQLPPLSRTFSDIDVSSVLNVAIEAQANLSPQPGDAPPPNGGLIAWLQVLGAFFCYFNSWGTMNSFGAFQTYYETGAGWNRTPSEISWIGSTQAFLSLMVGVFTGPLYDAGYFRPIICTGGFLVPFGYMMTSIATQYWQVLLAQGFVIGIGNGCLFVPAVAILPQYFSTKNPLVNGIAASGSSLGGLVIPFVMTRLERQIGFGWATRTVGFLALSTAAISIATMKPRLTPKSKRKLLELAAFKEPTYTLFTVGLATGFIGFAVPTFYLGTFASSTGIASPEFSFYYLPILNAASTFGRIIPAILAAKYGPLNVLIPICMLAGTLSLVWCVIKTSAGTIVFAIFYGFCSGGFAAMSPIALVTMTPDLRTLGTRMGQLFFCAALALLAGPPSAGAILTSTHSWVGLKCFAGGSVVLGSIILMFARASRVGWSLKKKA